MIVQQRKAVILSARVHPGETNASWMMKGFLDFLLGSSTEAKVALCHDSIFLKITDIYIEPAKY